VRGPRRARPSRPPVAGVRGPPPGFLALPRRRSSKRQQSPVSRRRCSLRPAPPGPPLRLQTPPPPVLLLTVSLPDRAPGEYSLPPATGLPPDRRSESRGPPRSLAVRTV